MKTYEFDEFCISTQSRKLSRSSGEVVALTPRVYDLLLALVESEGRVLSKDELLETVWEDCIVEEANLTQSIFVLRKALGDSRNRQFIRTIPTQGYRFICDVKVTDLGEPSQTIVEAEGTGISGSEPVQRSVSEKNWEGKRYYAPYAFAIVIVAAVAYFGLTDRLSSQPSPVYQQLTFERGTVWAARFIPNANAVIYNANLNGRPLDLFNLQLPTHEAREMNLAATSLLSISSKGEMAILLNQTYIYQFIHRGVLARMPIFGSAYREVAENVQEADWSPDGENLLVIRWLESGNRLEYPIDKTLVETTGYFSHPRISPNGERIAFFTHEHTNDNRGFVSVIDINGNVVVNSDEWSGLEGLAWHGNEVWFTASKGGESYALYAMTDDGKVRNVIRAPTNLILNDVGSDNSVLLSRAIQQTDVYLSRKTGSDLDLSWLQLIGVSDVSSDGTQFLFTHFGEGSGKNYAVYLRKTDGSAAVRLGEGRALALSPDGRFALAKLSEPEGLMLLRTGAGEAIPLLTGQLEKFGKAGWFPDGERIIFEGSEIGKERRSFVQNLNDGVITPITPEGVYGTLLSPDGQLLLVNDRRGDNRLISLGGGEMSSIKGLEDKEEIIRWDSTGSSLYVYDPLQLPIKIYRLQLADGHRELIREIQPSNTTGVFGNIYLYVTPDANIILYGLRRYLIDLYLVDGLE